jgi:probable HAF family extracellular repeat protein
LEPRYGHSSCRYIAGCDLGEIVGSSDLGDVNKPHAVLWDRAGVAQDLAILPSWTLTSAFDINVFGTVVGIGEIGVRAHAFIWTAKSGMKDLNSLIPANLGWELVNAVAINLFGQIVGDGILNGNQHAFLLTPNCILGGCQQY